MRKFIAILFASAVLLSCKVRTSNPGLQPLGDHNTDTVKVLALYKANNDWKMDTVFRLVKDTFRLSEIDTAGSNAKMSWVKDTVYYLPFIDTVSKKVQWLGLPPAFFQEVRVKPFFTDTTKVK